MSTIYIVLPHNKGGFEVGCSSDRQREILKDFLDIIAMYDLKIDKNDLASIVYISSK